MHSIGFLAGWIRGSVRTGDEASIYQSSHPRAERARASGRASAARWALGMAAAATELLPAANHPSIDDVRQCIRALVGVIQASAQGGSPVDNDQVNLPQHSATRAIFGARWRALAALHRLPDAHRRAPLPCAQMAHVRKVVKLLSIPPEQIDAMPAGERETVLSIRNSAVQKMKLAHTLNGDAASSGGGALRRAPAMPGVPSGRRASAPGSAPSGFAPMGPPRVVGSGACDSDGSGAQIMATTDCGLTRNRSASCVDSLVSTAGVGGAGARRVTHGFVVPPVPIFSSPRKSSASSATTRDSSGSCSSSSAASSPSVIGAPAPAAADRRSLERPASSPFAIPRTSRFEQPTPPSSAESSSGGESSLTAPLSSSSSSFGAAPTPTTANTMFAGGSAGRVPLPAASAAAAGATAPSTSAPPAGMHAMHEAAAAAPAPPHSPRMALPPSPHSPRAAALPMPLGGSSLCDIRIPGSAAGGGVGGELGGEACGRLVGSAPEALSGGTARSSPLAQQMPPPSLSHGSLLWASGGGGGSGGRGVGIGGGARGWACAGEKRRQNCDDGGLWGGSCERSTWGCGEGGGGGGGEGARVARSMSARSMSWAGAGAPGRMATGVMDTGRMGQQQGQGQGQQQGQPQWDVSPDAPAAARSELTAGGGLARDGAEIDDSVAMDISE